MCSWDAGAAVQPSSEREFHVPWLRLGNQSSICLNIFLSQMQLMTEESTAIEMISMNKTIFPKKNTEASCNSSNFMTCFHRFNWSQVTAWMLGFSGNHALIVEDSNQATQEFTGGNTLSAQLSPAARSSAWLVPAHQQDRQGCLAIGLPKSTAGNSQRDQ